MDKLKQQLGPVLKHFFWICIGVLAVTVLGSWWMSTSALEAQRTAQESAISSKFQAMDSLMGKAPKHPNPSTDAEMKKGLDASMKDVVLAWKKQYDRQKNIFVWPSQLRPETRAAFEPLTPIEAKVDFPETAAQKVDTPWREDYANYISGRLPELAKIVKARWSVDFKSSTSGGGGSEMAFGGAGNFGAPATGFASLATTPKIDNGPATVKLSC